MSNKYQHAYQDESVYGRVCGLVREYGPKSGVHLDIGCGHGPIAEVIHEMGLDYIGLDLEESSLAVLSSRGFEVRQVDLLDADLAIKGIVGMLAGRPVSSISMIDCLEHITNGPEVLEKLWELAKEHNSLLVVAVPNVAHRDLAYKLLVGRWDYTSEGLLDCTHVIHHTPQLLDAITRRSGWAEVGRADWSLEISDQCFPIGLPVLMENTPVGAYLRDLRNQAGGYSTVNELVRAYLPRGSQVDVPVLQRNRYERGTSSQPFLSIVTRTQGKRLANLRDVLLCLAAQTCQDFELLLIAHKTDFDTTESIQRVVDDTPETLRSKAKVYRCDHGTRTTPLNFGFERATGKYLAILDDDELVFAHWVATFRDLSERGLGKVLRTVAAEQDIVSTGRREDGALGFMPVSAIRATFPPRHDFFAHLRQNYSPPLCLAFPRLAFSELGIRFDESLNTAEDWDFEMRTAFVCGVESSPEITGIYRKWQSGESSFDVHSQEQWTRDYQRILSRLDEAHRIFPPGTVRHIVDQQNLITRLQEELLSLKGSASLSLPTGGIQHVHNRYPRFHSFLRRCYYALPLSLQRLARRML